MEPYVIPVTVNPPDRMESRRMGWIAAELTAEVTSAAMRVAAAHPDVEFVVRDELLTPDTRAEEVDVIGVVALRSGAADGRTTAEVAAAAGIPVRKAESALSHPKAGLRLGDDGRWYRREVN